MFSTVLYYLEVNRGLTSVDSYTLHPITLRCQVELTERHGRGIFGENHTTCGVG